MLPLLALLISSSLCGAENPAWNNLKQLSSGQQVRIVLDSKKSLKGQFQSVTDDAIIIHANGADQTLSRSSVQKVSSHRPGHRGRHALIGATIGAGAGLGTGAAIDNDCSRQSIRLHRQQGEGHTNASLRPDRRRCRRSSPRQRLAGSLSLELAESRSSKQIYLDGKRTN